MSSEAPENLKYTRDHEWLRVERDGTVTLGITDHAQEALGELVFVELPEEGASYHEGDACAVVESVKAANDVFCPISGEVTSANTALSSQPELVNNSPYEDGWLLRLRPESLDDIEGMMDVEAYQEYLGGLED